MSSGHVDESKPPFLMFSLSFTLVGFDLRRVENSLRRRLQFISRLIFITFHWIILVYDSFNSPSKYFFFQVSTVTSHILQAIIQIHVFMHLDEMTQFIAHLRRNTDHRIHRMLTFFSLIWSLAKLILTIYFIILQLGSISCINLLLYIYIELTDAFMTSVPLQCLALLSFYGHERRLLNSLLAAAANGRNDLIFNLSQEMTESFIKFEKLFSVFTPVLLIYSFTLMTSLLISFDEKNVILVSTILFFQCLTSIPITLMVWITDQITPHMSYIIFVYAMKCGNGYREISASLYQVVQHALSLRFTVCGLLPINRELVFSFISSVLTFSVLATQVMDGSFVPTDQCVCNNVSTTCS